MAKCNKLTPLPFKGLNAPCTATKLADSYATWRGLHAVDDNYNIYTKAFRALTAVGKFTEWLAEFVAQLAELVK